jgi:hypothetical protein
MNVERAESRPVRKPVLADSLLAPTTTLTGKSRVRITLPPPVVRSRK